MTEFNSTQPSFSSGIISTELFSRIDYNKLASGVKQCENWSIRPAGGASYRTGTQFIGSAKYSNKKSCLIPFSESRASGYCLEFGHNYIRFYKNGERITSGGNAYELVTTYTEDEVSELKYAQYRNQLYIAHKNHAPAVLTRFSDTNWTLVNLVFNPTVPAPSTVTIAKEAAKDPSTVVDYDKWQYAVSVEKADGTEGMATKSNIITSDIDLINQHITISFTAPTGVVAGDNFLIYRIFRGEFFFIHRIPFVTGTSSYSLTDLSFQPDTTRSIKEPFTGFNNSNYPSAVGFWNQRLIFANTPNKPNTIYGSVVGAFDDFTTTLLHNSDEAFELTLNSGTTDVITDIVPMDDLIIMTQSKIWRVVGTSPSNMSAYIESYSGSSGIHPYVYKKSILYVDSSFNTISNFIYSYELNGYVGQNLDTLCRDLMDGHTIKAISFRDTPYGILYAVRDDGVLLGLTYLKEENIYAWHQHTTMGEFIDVCSVDCPSKDEVYVIVKRDSNVYIEMFKNQIDVSEGINDSWHLDCATRFIKQTPGTTVSGLSRFNGKSVTVMADGNEYENVEVSNGSLTLERPCSNILVGLPYVGIIEPIPVDLKFQETGTTVGMNRRISKATLRYYRTRGLWYGTSVEKLYQIKPYVYDDIGEDIPLETNVLNIEVADTYKTESSFVVVQKSPFPALLQSITMGISYGEKN